MVKELRDSNFKQLVSCATRPISKSCLDHIWSNKPDRIVNIKCPDICISDHLPVLAVRLYKHCSRDKTKNHKFITYRNLKCLNQEKFVKALYDVPWDAIFVFNEVDDIVNGWYSLLNEAIDANAPVKRKRIRDDTKPKWLSPAILKLMKKRDHLLRKAKRSNAPDDWSALKSAKNKVTNSINTAKKNFSHESFRENENNPKKIWSALKELSGKQSPRGVTYLEENKTMRIKDDVSIAEVFNKHFTGLAESLVDKTAIQFNSKTLKSFVSKRNTSNVKHAFPAITPNQTRNLIEAIPSGKATGMDGVSARILKIAAPAIAPSLAKLINICIARGTFPTAWKEAKVTPIHKQNSKSDKYNYRLISVLPVLSKIFERHLHNSLSAFLKDNHLLYLLHSAFRRYHSTETALIEIVDRMLLNIDDNHINGLLLAEFQKAFDLVNHDLLIEKLRIYGLDDNSLDLMRSFLQNRTQRTVMRGAQSLSKTLTHRVPQGSILSPLLFLMHINDLPEAVSQPTTVDIFADDTTLSSCSPYMDTSRLCSKLCQSTLELEEWS